VVTDQGTELDDPALNVAHAQILPVPRFTLRVHEHSDRTSCGWIQRLVS
jgi:hypothetical protein